jgi:hypothetical protein
MSKRSLHQEIMRILDDSENMKTHQRREYWASQIILLVRRDEQQRIRKEVLAYYAVAPKAAEPILKIIGGGVSE